MSALFSGPPKLPKTPALKPPEDTQAEAEYAALARRQGSAAAMLTGPGAMRAGNPSLLSHTVTGA